MDSDEQKPIMPDRPVFIQNVGGGSLYGYRYKFKPVMTRLGSQ